MNHILQLQAENAELKKKLGHIEFNLDCLNDFLHSEKFRNGDSGERKDWISTTDVINWIKETKRNF